MGTQWSLAHRKASLGGWPWWALILLPPFAVLAFDTWLNTETFRKDYETAELNKRLREQTEDLDNLKIEEARLETMDRIKIEAPDLGLVEPEPGQIRIIHCTDQAGWLWEDSTPGTVARQELENPQPMGILDLVIRSILEKKGGAAAWDSDSYPNLASTTLMGDVLRKAIRSVCAPYLGDS